MKWYRYAIFKLVHILGYVYVRTRLHYIKRSEFCWNTLKLTLVLGSSTPVLGMKVKRRRAQFGYFL